MEASFLSRCTFITASRHPLLVCQNQSFRYGRKFPSRSSGFLAYRPSITSCGATFPTWSLESSRKQYLNKSFVINPCSAGEDVENSAAAAAAAAAAAVVEGAELGFLDVLVRRGLVLAAMVCGVLILGCRDAVAVEEVLDAGWPGVFQKSGVALRNSWPKLLQLLKVFKEQGLILAALLGLSAFFSMAETSITTLWPWKVFYLFPSGRL